MSLCLFNLLEEMLFFLKYSKEGRLSSSYVGIRNVSSDICYDDTKHYQKNNLNTGVFRTPSNI